MISLKLSENQQQLLKRTIVSFINIKIQGMHNVRASEAARQKCEACENT